MGITPIEPNKPQLTFGILQEYRNTSYGKYTKGIFKGYKIEIFDATEKHNQKLHYVSDNKLLNWVKSKLIYFQNGVKKVVRSEIKKNI